MADEFNPPAAGAGAPGAAGSTAGAGAPPPPAGGDTAGAGSEGTGSSGSAGFDANAFYSDFQFEDEPQGAPPVREDVFFNDEQLSAVPEEYRERVGALNSTARQVWETQQQYEKRLSDLGDVDMLRAQAKFGELFLAKTKVPVPNGQGEVEVRDFEGFAQHLYDQDPEGYRSLVEFFVEGHRDQILRNIFNLDPARLDEYRAASFVAPGFHQVDPAELDLVASEFHNVWRTLDQKTRDSLIVLDPNARAAALSGLKTKYEGQLAELQGRNVDPEKIAREVRAETWQQFEQSQTAFTDEYNQSYSGLLTAARAVASQAPYGDTRDAWFNDMAVGRVTQFFQTSPVGLKVNQEAESALRNKHQALAEGNKALAAQFQAQYDEKLLQGQRIAKQLTLKLRTEVDGFFKTYQAPPPVEDDPTGLGLKKTDLFAAGAPGAAGIDVPSNLPLDHPDYLKSLTSRLNAELRRAG